MSFKPYTKKDKKKGSKMKDLANNHRKETDSSVWGTKSPNKSIFRGKQVLD